MARGTFTPWHTAAGPVPRTALLALSVFALLLLAAVLSAPASAMPSDAVARTSQACTIRGSADDDTLTGTTGDDVICALGGDDRVDGRGGNDRILGGPGADRLRGDGGADVLLGGAGPDLLQGRAGDDRLSGGRGNDRLYGGAGADDLRGGRASDALGGGLGPDDISGGPGRDIAYYGQRPAPVRVSVGRRANDGAAGERDDIRSDVEDVSGGRGDDVLRGSRRANHLFGGAGGDRLVGGRGNDSLSGGAGTDRLDARDGGGASAAQNGAGFIDTVTCGQGDDTALVDPADVVDPDCENVVGRPAPSPPANRPPTGLALSNASVAENEAAGTTVGVLSAGDPDPGDTHSFALVPGAGSADNGSFQIVGSALRTAAVFDYETKSSYTVRVRATDFGTPAGQIVREFTITVINVNDPPVAVDDTATVLEDAPASAIDVLANDTDFDGGPKTISSASDPANGTVVITGGGTGLTYQPDLNYCNDPSGTTPDAFTYTLNGGSTAMVSVTVTCADDAPLAVNDSATVLEDAPATAVAVLANDMDVDGGPMTIGSVGDPANGTVVITGAGTGLTYEPDPGYCNSHAFGTPDTFTYTLNGGSTATVSMTVTCVPEDPVVDTSPGSTSYTENDPATPIDSAVTVTDPDPGAIASATIQITGGYAGAEDILALAGSHPGITPSVAGDTLTLTGDASPAAYQAALRDVTYRNGSETPSTAARTVTFTVTDETARTGSDTKGVTVIAVDDPPVAVNDSATVLEDAPATAVPVLANDTDVDGGPMTINSASDPANGTVVITGGGTGLTYQPDPNYCNDPPGTTPDTFTYTLNGGSNATVSLTVTCVNDAPVADDETFSGNDSAHGNTTMVVNDPDDGAPNPAHPKTTVTGDILAGDTDVDGPALSVTPGMFATNDGGSVTIESDGDFTFHPAASTSCTDTSDFFDYTVTDGHTPPPAGTDTGRVTIAIAGCVWYVSNNAAGNSGTSSAPFDTLTQAEAASGINHTVFVFDGDNTSTGLGGDGYAMNAGERLIGEHEGLVVDPDQGGGLTADTLHPANAGAHPTLTATNADVIDLDDGNELRGLNLDPQGTGGGIAGGAGDTGGGTIDDVNVADGGTTGTQPGLELNGTTGTFNVTNLVVNNSATGVLLTNAGTTDFGSTTITSAGAPGLSATGTNMDTSTFGAISVTGSGSGGVLLSGTTGVTTFGGLSLTTTSGAAPTFALSNAGTVSVPAVGTANVSATGGPAVDVTGTAGATLAFDAVSSTNSANDGINLAGLAAGTFTATSGTISGAAGIAFDLDGGSGAISYPGAIGNGTGSSVEITNRTGGTTTLSGAITDDGDAGGGINLTGNAGATFDLTGGMTLSTGTSTALNATGGGTFAVTGAANTLATTTATALNVANTNIGASDLTFRSIATNGAASGIVLNTTGSSGGLTVTGNAGACSSAATCTGGAIQNSTGPGINLSSVGGGVSLTRVSVNNGGDDGIRGAGVNGFALADSRIATNGNAVNESGLDFVGGLTGTSSVSSSQVFGSPENGMIVTNAAGSLNLAVTGSTLNSVSDASTGNDGLHLDANDTANITASVTGSTFSDNRGDHFQFSTNSTSSGTNSVTFSNNTLTGDRGSTHGGTDLGAGITISPDAAADTSFTISNNNIQGAVSNAVAVAPGAASVPAGVTSGTISGNTIGTAGTVDSGSAQAAGIAAYADGDGVHTVRIENNQVRQWSGFAGIDMLIRDGSPTLNATITGNTVANPGTFGGNGLLITAGAITTDAGTFCAAVTGNTLAGSGGGGTTDLRLRQRFLTTVRLPGYAGAASDIAAVVSFVQGNNPGAETGSATANFPAGGGGFVGGAACPTP